MQLRFHSHAVKRMRERNISVEEVEAIIGKPDGRIKQTKDKFILYKRFPRRKDNKIAAVVVEKIDEGFWEVITVLVNFEVRK